MESLKKFNNGVEKGILVVGSLMFIIMLFSCSWQVFTRYVLNNAAIWTEECARFAMCYVSMLGSIILLRHKGHVSMALLSNKVKNRTKAFILDMINILIILIFLYYMTYYGWLSTLSATKQVSTVLRINYSYIYACVPISGVLMIWFNLELILTSIYNYKDGIAVEKKEESD